MGRWFLILVLPSFSFANGILDRAAEQYSKRDYTEVGRKNADNARYNYGQLVNKLFNVEGEYARARYLQAENFLLLASPDNRKFLLQDSIGQAMQGFFYFQRTFGRDPFKSSTLNERGKKIYADLLYWKGVSFFEWIKDQGGNSAERKKIVEETQAIISLGYGCMNDGGPYQLLGSLRKFEGDSSGAANYFQKAFDCTQVSSSTVNWNGQNVLNQANSLAGAGKKEAAVLILKQFVAQVAEQLSFDFIPENKKTQILAAQKLKELGAARPSEFVPGEYLVQFKKDRLNRLNFSGLDIKEQIGKDLFLVRRPAVEMLASSVSILSANPDVKIVEPNYIFKISNAPNDPRFSETWGLSNIGQLDSKGQKGLKGIDINAEKAWEITTGSRDMIVAVIDTGIDFTSPDLKDNAWTNKAEAQGKPGVDDDGNGYVDDIHGYDFLANKGVVIDDHGHGTHVAGTIGARGNDGTGVAGINWNIQLMALKFMGANGGGDLASAIKAIRYATKMGAKITNNSWGGGDNSELLKQAIQEASSAGVLFVAAAGNSGENSDVLPQYPAAFDITNIISVAAIDNRGQLANFSNYGTKTVHIAAPGENILSTIPGGFDSWSGTSMAAPHIAGAAALVWSHEPNLTMTEVKERILSTCAAKGSLRGKIKSSGMLDLFAALTKTTPKPDPYDPQTWETKNWPTATEHNYKNNSRLYFEFTVPGASALAIYFTRFQTEMDYDKAYFIDSENRFLGVWSGLHNAEFGPTAEGDSIRMSLVTDSLTTDHGFEINKVMFKKEN